jgi:speckle-type POZ protein
MMVPTSSSFLFLFLRGFVYRVLDEFIAPRGSVLLLIYTDDFPQEQEDIEFRSLRVAAGRCALDLSKLFCAQKLLENVTVDTVAAPLNLAKTCNWPELRKCKCLDHVAAPDP